MSKPQASYLLLFLLCIFSLIYGIIFHYIVFMFFCGYFCFHQYLLSGVRWWEKLAWLIPSSLHISHLVWLCIWLFCLWALDSVPSIFYQQEWGAITSISFVSVFIWIVILGLLCCHRIVRFELFTSMLLFLNLNVKKLKVVTGCALWSIGVCCHGTSYWLLHQKILFPPEVGW